MIPVARGLMYGRCSVIYATLTVAKAIHKKHVILEILRLMFEEMFPRLERLVIVYIP